MRPRGSPEYLEERRLRAVELLDEGLSLHEVARRIGCDASSVLRWRDARRSGGEAALIAKPASGRPPKLSAMQQARLVRLLSKGALSYGYRTDLWTTDRIARLVESKLGVKYHRNHVGKLLHQLGWSHQKPESRAVERNDEEIDRWKRNVWPRVKKTPRGWATTSSSLTNRGSF